MYTAELCAINEALKFLIIYEADDEFFTKDINIYSDSLSSVTALSNFRQSTETELLHEIVNSSKRIRNKVTFAWIRAMRI